MSDELAKCPFCGSDFRIWETDDYEELWKWKASCNGDNCIYTLEASTKEELIEYINDRPVEAALRQQLAAAVQHEAVLTNHAVRLEQQLAAAQQQVEELQAKVDERNIALRMVDEYFIPQEPEGFDSMAQHDVGMLVYQLLQGETVIDIRDTNKQLAAAHERAENFVSAFQELTPGGSEFADDPERCVRWIQERRESDHQTILRMKRERDASQDRERAYREALLSIQVELSDDTYDPDHVDSVRRIVDAVLAAVEPQG